MPMVQSDCGLTTTGQLRGGSRDAKKQRAISAPALHWPGYLMEGAELGIFMISACVFSVLLDYPGSSVYRAIADPFVRRLLGGLAMAATAISIIYSPWGKQSGAHMNPALTLTFLRLKKVETPDALFYVVAQFLGGVAGVTVATDIKVYFCDPQSPWQRGTNENTNLLLRQYFPRGTDLSVHSQAQLDQVALRLNQRPRRTLGFEIPASKLRASVASTI
jgi:hypothetical protein